MQHQNDDLAYLCDMLKAAQEISGFVRDVILEDYERDRKLHLAVERCFEIIGEAARNVSASCKEAHPDIPWRAIVGLRNVITHDYGHVKYERLWLTATDRVPELVDRLLEILK